MSDPDLSSWVIADRDGGCTPHSEDVAQRHHGLNDTQYSESTMRDGTGQDEAAATQNWHSQVTAHSDSGHTGSSPTTTSIVTMSVDGRPPAFASPPQNSDCEAPTWRKILYAKQPFEDNYIDPSQFLQDMRANANVPNYEYADVVKSTFAITQQISIVVLFVYVFAKVYTDQMGSHALLYIDIFIFVASWIVYVQFVKSKSARLALDIAEPPEDTSTPLLSSKQRQRHYGLHYGRQGLSLGIMLLLLSPIMRTLTAAYSDDTIVAMSIIAMSLSVLLADYTYLNGDKVRFTPSTSENAATFGVVLMASRIKDALDSGSLVAFGALCFTISLIARRWLRRLSFTAHVGLTFLLFGLAAGCLIQIPTLAVLYVAGMLAINFLIPWAFVTLHSNAKYQINGPWDEARPTNSAAAAEWARAGLLS